MLVSPTLLVIRTESNTDSKLVSCDYNAKQHPTENCSFNYETIQHSNLPYSIEESKPIIRPQLTNSLQYLPVDSWSSTNEIKQPPLLLNSIKIEPIVPKEVDPLTTNSLNSKHLEQIQITQEFINEPGTENYYKFTKYNEDEKGLSSKLLNLNENEVKNQRKNKCNTSNNITNAKKFRQSGTYEILNQTVYNWYKENLKRGIILTDFMIRQHAVDINKQLKGRKDFTASDNWLKRWKKNFNKYEPVYVINSNGELNKVIDNCKEDNRKCSQDNLEKDIINKCKEEKSFGNDCIFEETETNIYNQNSVISNYEAVENLEKIIKYFEANKLANTFELNVLLKLKLVSQDMIALESRKCNKSPEFFACN